MVAGAPVSTTAPYRAGLDLPKDEVQTSRERRVATAPAARSAASASRGTGAARKASLAARSRRSREAVHNPTCPACGTRTVQNLPEHTRRVFWCTRCQRYPFGSGGPA